MKVYLIIMLAVSFSKTVFAINVVNEKADAFLLDSDKITNTFKVPLPTLSFKKEMAIPNSPADKNGPLVFQNGQQILTDKIDHSKAYCTLGGQEYNTMANHEKKETHYTVKAGERVMFFSPLIHKDVDAKFRFDESSKQITGIESKKVEYTLDFILNRNTSTAYTEESLLENGDITKPVMKKNDDSAFYGNLKCFHLKKIPTTGEIRNILGANNISVMPDNTEPQRMAVPQGMKAIFEKENTDMENEKEKDTRIYKVLIDELNAKILPLLKNQGSDVGNYIDKEIKDSKGKSSLIIDGNGLMEKLEKAESIQK